MRVQINVTQEHIEAGQAKSCELCPIALAVGEVVRFGTQIEIARNEFTLRETNRGYRSGVCYEELLPDEARQFIKEFDRGLGPDPVSFTLDIPVELLRTVA